MCSKKYILTPLTWKSTEASAGEYGQRAERKANTRRIRHSGYSRNEHFILSMT
jgi:hypothetical protein